MPTSTRTTRLLALGLCALASAEELVGSACSATSDPCKFDCGPGGAFDLTPFNELAQTKGYIETSGAQHSLRLELGLKKGTDKGLHRGERCATLSPRRVRVKGHR